MSEKSEPETPEPAPQSPCVAVCIVHPSSGLCMGCFRTADEITDWPTASVERKREILAQLKEREERELRRGK